LSESYRDLIAWQKAMALVTRVYEVTEPFPRREIFGLTRQVRDAALSVPSNIAEGKGRQTKKDYVQFLYRARGSLFETQTQLEAARNLEFLPRETFAKISEEAQEVGRVLDGLIKSIQRQIARPPES
jgi:four helix bundle protein